MAVIYADEARRPFRVLAALVALVCLVLALTSHNAFAYQFLPFTNIRVVSLHGEYYAVLRLDKGVWCAP